jgi:sensor histidine kinase YesM
MANKTARHIRLISAGSDFWKGFYIGLVLSSVCIYLSGGYDLWLFSRQRNMLKVAQSKRASEQAQAMQRETELRLSVLAAQVEPHFLFNTLAGVRSAISTEPARAVAIVDHLVDYLRATIPQMRDDGGSVQSRLSKQLDAVHAYLSLMQARIPRLSFSVESQIADAAVPPLMLISLVENAIKHGIEPKVGAAHIAVTVVSSHKKRKKQSRACWKCALKMMASVLAVTTVALALVWRISISGWRRCTATAPACC